MTPPWSPCGLAVDLLRSCYSTDMAFYSGDLTQTCKVHWYFVEEGTPFLDFYHTFGSGNWADQTQDWPGVGEVLGAARPWRDGSTVGDAPGLVECGTLDQWQNGQPEPPATPVPVDQFGTPICCGQTFTGFGTAGTFKGASAEPFVIQTITTACTPAPLPVSMVARFSASGGCECLDGVEVPVAWDPTFSHWGGSFTACSAPESNVNFACDGETFVCAMGTETLGGCETLIGYAVSGTYGADPELTATLSVIGCCTGTVIVTLTRT